jgi:hypothetical protein
MSRKVTKIEDFRYIQKMFHNLEDEFNKVEAQLTKNSTEAEANLNVITWHFGKAYEIYKIIVEKLEIFEPKRRPTAPENLREVVVRKKA